MGGIHSGRDRKHFALGFGAGSIALVLGAAGYLLSGLPDVRADVPIPGWIASVLSSSIHASVRRQAPKASSPLSGGDDTLIAGGKLYLNDCVGCHGEPGKPPSDFGNSFYPLAPQLPAVGTAYQQPEVFWVAKHGIRRTGMGAQGFNYSDKDLWSLAAFISRIKNLPPEVIAGIHRKPTESSEPPK